MTQGEVQTLEQTRADRQPQFLQPLGATAHAVHQLLQTPLALLFDHLAIDQIGMGLLKRLLRASRLSRAREGLQRMGDRKQSRRITAKAITEKARDPKTAAAVIRMRDKALSNIASAGGRGRAQSPHGALWYGRLIAAVAVRRGSDPAPTPPRPAWLAPGVPYRHSAGRLSGLGSSTWQSWPL